MVNPLLKLLGTEYEMKLYYKPSMNGYVVNISDHQGNKIRHALFMLDAELAYHDVLLCVVEQCILSLTYMPDN